MDVRAALTELWPLFGLEVRTPRLTLRFPDDADVVAFARLSDDIHDPGFLPFAHPWSMLPDGEREQGILKHNWGTRSTWSVDQWHLSLATVVDGEVVGSQSIGADHFPSGRTFGTGSWLARRAQGEGIGTEMRAAVLHLGFAGLGALRAETGAIEGNHSSMRVTEKLGYRPNGDAVHGERGERRRELRYVLERADWEAGRRDDIEIVGLDPCRPMFGLGSPEGDAVA